MDFPEFLSRFTDCRLSLNEKLSEHGGYKTGGRAKYFVTPKSVRSLSETVNYCVENGVKYAVIGRATNVLFSDGGFDGAIISTGGITGINIDGERVKAFCGESLISLCKFAADNCLSGLEELSGIPGSVGGAVVMNAGAFGKTISSLIEEVTTVKNGKIVFYGKDECGFSYRKSRFLSGDEIVLSVKTRLFSDEKSDIIERTERFFLKRKDSQPKGRSCGSVFRNPDGSHAAKLIEGAGLKGLSVGGAVVSPVHANFIIANGGATSGDVYALIKRIKDTVKYKYGVFLEEEIRYVGEFN